MRNSKIYSGSTSGCCPWILAFAGSLLLLIVLSRPFLHDQFSAPTINYHIVQIPEAATTVLPSKQEGYPPVLAYWIYGTNGDGKRMLRLLKAIYHPRNQYLLQLDADSSNYERTELVLSVQSEKVFCDFGNVNVVGKGYAVNQMGSSALSAMLHAAALFLKLNADWDWFINLSASDYPLVSQDDLLHAISSLPRDLNFISYASSASLKERRHSINQIVMDPSLYLQKRSHLFYAVERRKTPNAFKIFGGSPWLMLTKSFMEYCVQGWENLPRKLLMYFSNTANPMEFYFHTVLCNSPEFQNTTVENNLRYNVPTNNGDLELEKIVASGAAFARPFKEGDPMLNKIDESMLKLLPNGLVPGEWCLSHGGINNGTTTETSEVDEEGLCSNWGNIDVVKPGSHGLLLSKVAIEERLTTNQCHQ